MATASLSSISSLILTPLHPQQKLTYPTYISTKYPQLIRCKIASSPSRSSKSSSEPKNKKRIWKEGEFPALSENSIPGFPKTRTQIKNVKKKLDRKAKAKAWVNTVTESLSDLIFKKQWLQALEVPLSFSLSSDFYCHILSPVLLYSYVTQTFHFILLSTRVRFSTLGHGHGRG